MRGGLLVDNPRDGEKPNSPGTLSKNLHEPDDVVWGVDDAPMLQRQPVNALPCSIIAPSYAGDQPNSLS
jgi:hypothetical protein